MAELGNALLLQVSQLEQRLTSEADTVRRMQVHVAEKRSQLGAAQREAAASESALGVRSEEAHRLGLVRETKAAMLDARAALHAQLGADLSELQRVELCLLAKENEQNAAFLAALQANEASIRAVNELVSTKVQRRTPEEALCLYEEATDDRAKEARLEAKKGELAVARRVLACATLANAAYNIPLSSH